MLDGELAGYGDLASYPRRLLLYNLGWLLTPLSRVVRVSPSSRHHSFVMILLVLPAWLPHDAILVRLLLYCLN